MRYEMSHISVSGPVRSHNEDSLCYKQAVFMHHRIAMAVICDGMGGMEQGQLASASVVRAFDKWFDDRLQGLLTGNDFQVEGIINEWRRLIGKLNQQLYRYGNDEGIKLGTTLSAILFFDDKYVIGHVGDSRIYAIRIFVRKLTTDQSLMPGSNVLLECIGVSDKVNPCFYSGRMGHGHMLLCTDGFWHKVSCLYIAMNFGIGRLLFGKNEKEAMHNRLLHHVRRCISKGETDNISAVVISIKR